MSSQELHEKRSKQVFVLAQELPHFPRLFKSIVEQNKSKCRGYNERIKLLSNQSKATYMNDCSIDFIRLRSVATESIVLVSRVACKTCEASF